MFNGLYHSYSHFSYTAMTFTNTLIEKGYPIKKAVQDGVDAAIIFDKESRKRYELYREQMHKEID